MLYADWGSAAATPQQVSMAVKELLCSENYSTFIIDPFVPSKS